MKRLFFFLSLLCLCAHLEAAAPYKNAQGFWVFEIHSFNAKRGDWNKKSNWAQGKVPEGIVRVDIKSGSTVTISRPIAKLGNFNIGIGEPTAKTLVVIEDGAKIDAYTTALPQGYLKGVEGEILMKGGEYTVGNYKEHNGTLDVGFGGTFSGTGRFVISGGKLVAGVKVGSTIANTQNGTFRIEGSAATISTHRQENNFFMLFQSGTLEFALDDKGVSPLDYRQARIWLYDGATVRVDGKNYKGSTKNIPLIRCDLLTVQNIKTEVTGFNTPYTATVSYNEGGATLRITKK